MGRLEGGKVESLIETLEGLLKGWKAETARPRAGPGCFFLNKQTEDLFVIYY